VEIDHGTVYKKQEQLGVVGTMVVKPGNPFEVSWELYSNGIVSCDEKDYRLTGKNVFDDKRNIEGNIILEPGQYKFHTNGITIEEVELFR